MTTVGRARDRPVDDCGPYLRLPLDIKDPKDRRKMATQNRLQSLSISKYLRATAMSNVFWHRDRTKQCGIFSFLRFISNDIS